MAAGVLSIASGVQGISSNMATDTGNDQAPSQIEPAVADVASAPQVPVMDMIYRMYTNPR